MKTICKTCGWVIAFIGAGVSISSSQGTNFWPWYIALFFGFVCTFIIVVPFFAMAKILEEIQAIRYETKNIFYNSDFKDRKSMLAEDAWECPKCKKIHHGSVKKCGCGEMKIS